MNVNRRTPRTEMQEAIFMDRIAEFSDDLAKKENMPGRYVDWQLMKFINYSVRINPNGDDAGFELGKIGDTPDELRAKFIAYLDNANTEVTKVWDSAIASQDKPVNSTIAPEALPEDAPTKKK